MHALDAKYHRKCLTTLANRVRKDNRESAKSDQKSKVECFVLGELVSYIEESHQDESMPAFKLLDLGKLYVFRPLPVHRILIKHEMLQQRWRFHCLNY